MKYVSLFSGIGGFEQALDSLGWTCVLASEIDRFAEQSYQTIYGRATAGDITKIDAKDVPDHDVLVGGFPCQAFSVAGNRKGFEDTRGTLFFEIARIAKEKQPKALLLENVKGLVNHGKGDTMRIMLETLNEIGYVVDFEVLNSKFYNVPQNRERVFIVALRKDLANKNDWTIQGTTIVPKAKQRMGDIESFNFNFPNRDTVTKKLRDILEDEVDEKYYLSDEQTAALLAQLEEKDLLDSEGIVQVGNLDQHVRKRTNPHTGRVYSVNGVCPTVNTVGGGNLEPKILLPIREATKKGYALAEEGDSVNFVFPESKTRRGRVGKQIANTLEATSINQGVVELDYRIRKLTPRECWRLQGFPDSVHDAVERAGLSDTQRYKQAGNAVTVNVIRALGMKLYDTLQ